MALSVSGAMAEEVVAKTSKWQKNHGKYWNRFDDKLLSPEQILVQHNGTSEELTQSRRGPHFPLESRPGARWQIAGLFPGQL